MSKYTTGEIAKLCGVSVRTVQYYDSRGILVPSQLSEGGRRLYSDDDLSRMKTICFLRDLGLSINSIGDFLSHDEPGKVLSMLLDQREKELKHEVSRLRANLDTIEGMRRELKNSEGFALDSISDIAAIMSGKKKLKRFRRLAVLIGIPVAALQWFSIFNWIFTGIWWPFVLWLCLALVYGIAVSRVYFKSVDYICPQCHTQFKPRIREAFWANHNSRLRKLHCPNCGHHGWCVEVWTGAAED